MHDFERHWSPPMPPTGAGRTWGLTRWEQRSRLPGIDEPTGSIVARNRMGSVSVTPSFDKALGELYREHARSLVQMLWVFVGDRAEAEDLVQGAFLRLQGARGRLDHTQNMGAYLRATAFNLARSGFRRRSVALRHEERQARYEAPADETVMLKADQTAVMTAVRRLPARQRQCVVLRYWDNQSDAEIATTLGISVNSVKTHLRRALAGLERSLDALESSPIRAGEFGSQRDRAVRRVG